MKTFDLVDVSTMEYSRSEGIVTERNHGIGDYCYSDDVREELHWIYRFATNDGLSDKAKLAMITARIESINSSTGKHNGKPFVDTNKPKRPSDKMPDVAFPKWTNHNKGNDHE